MNMQQKGLLSDLQQIWTADLAIPKHVSCPLQMVFIQAYVPLPCLTHRHEISVRALLPCFTFWDVCFLSFWMVQSSVALIINILFSISLFLYDYQTECQLSYRPVLCFCCCHGFNKWFDVIVTFQLLTSVSYPKSVCNDSEWLPRS